MAFVQGFFIDVISPGSGLIEFTTDPYPKGTNVFANISLSFLNTMFEGNSPDPKFAASAWVDWWTTYLPDGSESEQQPGSGFDQNAVGIENVSRISFVAFVDSAWAIAQINVLSL